MIAEFFRNLRSIINTTLLIQNTIKLLTLGFFISMITGFVMYRMGYFSSEKTEVFHPNPNGGELLVASIDQDTNQTPAIKQSKHNPIMSSSKSIVPVIDQQELKQRSQIEILPSSKSMIHPIEIKVDKDAITEINKKKEVKPSPIPEDSDSLKQERKKTSTSKAVSNEIKPANSNVSNDTIEKPTNISWGTIGLGVLGILFVGVGSIVYFKRRSK